MHLSCRGRLSQRAHAQTQDGGVQSPTVALGFQLGVTSPPVYSFRSSLGVDASHLKTTHSLSVGVNEKWRSTKREWEALSRLKGSLRCQQQCGAGSVAPK